MKKIFFRVTNRWRLPPCRYVLFPCHIIPRIVFVFKQSSPIVSYNFQPQEISRFFENLLGASGASQTCQKDTSCAHGNLFFTI